MKMRMILGGAAAAALLAIPLIALARGGEGEMTMGAAMTVAENAAGNPTVAVDGRDGTGYVAWIATADGAPNVFVARVGADGTRSDPVRVNDRPGDAAPHEQAPAQVAVGPDGAVYVLWQNNTKIAGRRFPASDLRFARSTDGGRTFSPAVTVNDDAGGGHGGGMTSEEGLPPSEIRVSKSMDGGRTFGASVVVDTAPCPCCRTSLAVAADGTVYLAWRKEYAGDVRDVVVARLAADAAAFDEPVRVHADTWVFPACPHAGPSLAVDGRGRVHVGWYTGEEARQGLWYARSEDGARTFSAPEALVTGADITPSQVALSPDGDGVMMAWDDRPEDGRRVSVARVDGAGEMVRMGRVEGRIPALESTPAGALLAWHDRQTVRAARIGSR